MDLKPIPLSPIPYAEFFNDIWKPLQLVIENAQDCHKLIVAIGNYIADVSPKHWSNLMKASQNQNVNPYGFVWIMNTAFDNSPMSVDLGKTLAESMTAAEGKLSVIKNALCLIFLKLMECRYTAGCVPEPFLPGFLFLLQNPKFKAKLMLPIELEPKYRQFASSFYQGQPVWLGASREHPFFSAVRLRLDSICAPTAPGATRHERLTLAGSVQTQQVLKTGNKLKHLENIGYFHPKFRENGRMDGSTSNVKVDKSQIQLVERRRNVNFEEAVQVIPASAPTANSTEGINTMDGSFSADGHAPIFTSSALNLKFEKLDGTIKNFSHHQKERPKNTDEIGQSTGTVCPNAEDHLYNSQINELHGLVSSVVNISKEQMFHEMVNYILDKYSSTAMEEVVDMDLEDAVFDD